MWQRQPGNRHLLTLVIGDELQPCERPLSCHLEVQRTRTQSLTTCSQPHGALKQEAPYLYRAIKLGDSSINGCNIKTLKVLKSPVDSHPTPARVLSLTHSLLTDSVPSFFLSYLITDSLSPCQSPPCWSSTMSRLSQSHRGAFELLYNLHQDKSEPELRSLTA